MQYTFRCRKCSRLTVVEHAINAPHPTVCHHIDAVNIKEKMGGEKQLTPVELGEIICGGELVRVYDAPSVVYKGSGFYSTDKRLTPVHPDDCNPDED